MICSYNHFVDVDVVPYYQFAAHILAGENQFGINGRTGQLYRLWHFLYFPSFRKVYKGDVRKVFRLFKVNRNLSCFLAEIRL